MKTSGVLVPVVACLLLIAAVDAGADSTQRQGCIGGKRGLVGRDAFSITKCDAKAVKTGASLDPACETNAAAKLQAGWTDVEGTPVASACVNTGDVTIMTSAVHDEMNNLRSLLMVAGGASSCTSGKLKSSGKAIYCGLRCAQKAALSGNGVNSASLADCRASCSNKMISSFGSAEKKPDCHTTGDSATVDTQITGFVSAAIDGMPPPITNPCTLPGSIQFTAMGTTTVAGGDPSWPDLTFLHLPNGFCAHYFGTVGNARQVRFAPGGELFVASPTRLTTSGGANGHAAVIVLPDDDRDGVADKPVTFKDALTATQGLMFYNGYFYYQDDIHIMRVPYAAGERAPSAGADTVGTIDVYMSPLHWPKTLDVADDGTIYVGNGGDNNETCQQPPPFHGGILKLDTLHGTQVAKGMRNPILVRCAHGHNRCFALELALDFSASSAGREKLLPIHAGDDWGFPCCATKDTPYTSVSPTPDCSGVAPENASFLIGDTPFGLDFAPGSWPGMYSGTAIVALHGAAGSWSGARMVAIAMDQSTGLPMPGQDLNGNDTGAMTDFATGWDDNTRSHGRPTDITFAPDGRLYVSDDQKGVIAWIAPIQ
ncbi:MAG TPA: hypothetical protein VGK20_01530 [Candidatus Binatia bacterium]